MMTLHEATGAVGSHNAHLAFAAMRFILARCHRPFASRCSGVRHGHATRLPDDVRRCRDWPCEHRGAFWLPLGSGGFLLCGGWG